jgi:hypothetical protein
MSPEQETPGSAPSGEKLDRGSEAASSSSSSGGSVDRPGGTPAESGAATKGRRGRDKSSNMLPGRQRRRFGLERILVRLIATAGIIGVGVVIAAIMVSSKSQSWIIGLVVSGVTVILSAILWSSRSL